MAKVEYNGITHNELNNFVHTYLSTLNKRNIFEILNFYDSHVNYFSKGIVDKNFIRKDKEKYYQLWPIIRCELTSEIIVQDTEDESVKLVEFDINFYVYNPKRGSISGTARNYLKIRKTSVGPKIFDEKQQVFNREKNSG